MTEEDLKVTDKRMFTPEGELREEFRHLESAEAGSADAAGESRDAAAPEPRVESETIVGAAAGASGPIITDDAASGAAGAPVTHGAPGGGAQPASAPSAGGPEATETPSAQPPTSGELSILDLVGLLAEHTALYLGEASLPDGKSVRDLRAAKLHLDLLDVLKAKTAGNLTDDEQAIMDDILYRLRMLYVEKKRQE